MTAKHYKLVADSLKECMELCLVNPEPIRTKAETVQEVAKHLAFQLAQYDSKFNKDKFLEECGL